MLDRKPRTTERFRNLFLEFYRSKSDHNSGSQTSLPKDAKKRRDGILELSGSTTRFERGRKDGMQEGFSMPQSYKKRKDGVQEGVSQPELVGSNSADGWVHKKLSLHTAYPPPPLLFLCYNRRQNLWTNFFVRSTGVSHFLPTLCTSKRKKQAFPSPPGLNDVVPLLVPKVGINKQATFGLGRGESRFFVSLHFCLWLYLSENWCDVGV